MSATRNARGQWVCVYCLKPWRRGHVCPPITPKPLPRKENR